MTRDDERTGNDPAGLDMHGAEPVEHRFATLDADGNTDVEFNLVLPLTPKRHRQLEHLLEEGYSTHEAYVLIAGGEILAHIDALKRARGRQ